MKNLLVFCFVLHNFYIFSQQKNYVHKPFASTHIIQSQTTEVIPKGAFELVIQHKFGMTNTSKNLIDDFLGMDLPSNIRFAFHIPITNNGYIGIGRTKFGKTYDIEGKYRMLRQTYDNKMPISLSAYGNMAITTIEFPTLTENYFYEDGITPFEHTLLHRLRYEYTITANRKFNRWLTFQLTTSLLHSNLVQPRQKNNIFIVSGGGGIKTGLLSAILFEYNYCLNDNNIKNQYAFAYEIQTTTHTFQIHISTNNEILNQHYYIQNSFANFTNGNFYLGFTLNKLFWLKK